ncbi:hypothetical protein BRAS3843_1220004 [Bradyrhizobium sp. STM 3843]|uniref:hypothetical protein n=1 Tax=Bradyrhizobium sp. STM 3843 TaxID=551947 RepID=UPI000240A987|nr:hypothetical protein [Bradyrhizobium sp. STM 3843]CCE04991.1 hypothetical protein BRAS3843_1220004 [Bradyrhizobium sp. STM 3843]
MSDPEGRRGFVGLAGGEVTALDLTTGAVIWGRTGLGQPLAANLSRLVTLHHSGGELALRLTDALTGQDIARISGLDLPNWAQEVIGEPNAICFHAKNEGTSIRVSWSLRRPYRGGAPPGPAIAGALPAAHLSGSILLDPANGDVLERGQGTAPVEQLRSVVSTDPSVLAQEQIGDRVYRLKVAPVAPGGAEMAVEASSAANGNVEWITPVGTVPDIGPTPLRP